MQRLARSQGLEIRSSSWRDPRSGDDGTYALVDPASDAIVAGFSLDRIEEYLTRASGG